MDAPINKPIKTANELINGAIVDVAVPAVKAIIVYEAPFFGLPVISPLVDLVLNTVANLLVKQLSTFATLVIVDLQTHEERTAYGAAEQALRKAHLTGDQNAIDAATLAFKTALAKLIHYDGSGII